MIKTKFTDYTQDETVVGEAPVELANRIEITYDGGRLRVHVDGTEVYENKNVGNDFDLILCPRKQT